MRTKSRFARIRQLTRKLRERKYCKIRLPQQRATSPMEDTSIRSGPTEGYLLQVRGMAISLIHSKADQCIGAAMALKYARAQDLPSFPSVGIDKDASAFSAANLANR